MPASFLYSDPHFSHAGVCKFFRADGVTKLRPFEDITEMDEYLIERFNETVRPNDKVYFLGDVVINRKALAAIMPRLNGDKVLIRGNHDIFKLSDYTPYFRDIRAYHVLNGMILSHIPIHESSMGRFRKNLHGHLHEKRVMKARGVDNRTGQILYGDEPDLIYFCCCVEQTDYAPILFEDVLRKMEDDDKSAGFIDVRPSILGPD
jgi:calcineurin-like phosphoesterase family protein